MKNRFLLTASLGLLTLGAMQAQVQNRAINFETKGTVDCGQLPALNELKSYTIQFWINPSQWTEGATILSRGDNFTVKLGAAGKVVFTVGAKSLTASSSDLKAGAWNAVMLICDNGTAEAYVNNQSAGTGVLDAVPDSDDVLTLGGGYAGKLDEVRLWKAALADDFEYFTNNTLNKWAPQWSDLMVYYKMDQTDDCKVLADYRTPDDATQRWNNHGIMNDGVSRVAADNEKMPYLWNAGYISNERFIDRMTPRDQYLLSNGIIILGSRCNATDGSVRTITPNNHIDNITGGTYMAEFDGRTGVLALDGKNGSRITATGDLLPQVKDYTFETWIYLDEWNEGAFIVRRETDDGKHGFSVRLGDEADKRIIVRVNGNDFASRTNRLSVGRWNHIGIATGNATSVDNAFQFWRNGQSSAVDGNESDNSTVVLASGNNDCKTYVGEGIKGKFDETAFWTLSAKCSDHMNRMPIPMIERNATVTETNNCTAAYMFDDPDNLEFSDMSQDGWLKQMKKAYDGYAGAHFYMSVASSDNWFSICGNATKRKKFAADLAKISEPYDGVELDLEWIYGLANWTTYSLLSDEIVAALPEGKHFRISLHNVSYEYPKGKMGDVDGFTFQQYGPQPTHFNYSTFKSYTDKFISYGFPKDKIVTSYSTTTSQGSGANGTSPIKGVKDGFFADDYVPSNADTETKKLADGYTYTFMGPLQVYKRAKYTRELGLQGIFYWDMGNDYWLGTTAEPEMPKYNSAKYCSYAINANVDPIMSGAKAIHFDPNGNYPEDDENGINDAINSNGQDEPVQYFNLQGIRVENPENGLYITRQGDKTTKVIVK